MLEVKVNTNDDYSTPKTIHSADAGTKLVFLKQENCNTL